MIYLDSSALLKLLIDEPESGALTNWLDRAPPAPRVTSELALTELSRGLRRRRATRLLPVARELLDGLALMLVTRDLLDAASDFRSPDLRTLDAIHLAAAVGLHPALDWFVAYDRRLLAAARRERLPIAHPGMSAR